MCRPNVEMQRCVFARTRSLLLAFVREVIRRKASEAEVWSLPCFVVASISLCGSLELLCVDFSGAESASERARDVLSSSGERKWLRECGSGGEAAWVPVPVVEDGSAGCDVVGVLLLVLKD
jgi:hypothetical protein